MVTYNPIYHNCTAGHENAARHEITGHEITGYKRAGYEKPVQKRQTFEPD